MSRFQFALALLLVVQAGVGAERSSIILMIGDGMGPAYTTAYRYFQDDGDAPGVDSTVFDELLVGAASTWPSGAGGLVTDSAASATAIASGVKTYNGAIGVDPAGTPLQTVLELAKARGYRTGIVVTSTVTHATPASFATHVADRNDHAKIARQYLYSRGGPQVDLLVGGGRRYFRNADRDLLPGFEAAGYTVAHSLDEYLAGSLPMLALLGENALPTALDGADPTRLSTLTARALELLDGEPFFLLVEGSQIDWCGHANDIACGMAEMHDFARTVEYVAHYVGSRSDALLLVTADHATGGLSLGANDQYLWLPDVVRRVRATSAKIVERLYEQPGNWAAEWASLTGISLTPEERERFRAILNGADARQAPDSAPADIDFETLLSCAEAVARPISAHSDVRCYRLLALQALVVEVINARSHTGWTTHGHTAVDVQIFAHGGQAQQFRGLMDNTDIGKKLLALIGRTPLPAAERR